MHHHKAPQPALNFRIFINQCWLIKITDDTDLRPYHKPLESSRSIKLRLYKPALFTKLASSIFWDNILSDFNLKPLVSLSFFLSQQYSCSSSFIHFINEPSMRRYILLKTSFVWCARKSYLKQILKT